MGRVRDWARGVFEATSARRPMTIASLVAVAAAYGIALSPLPFSARSIAQASAGGVLDTRIGYGPERGAAALAALGEEGRARYGDYLIADYVFLLIYSFALANALFALFRGSRRVWLAAIPLATGLFDLVEDVALHLALSAYPAPADAALAVAGAVGALKHAGFVLSILLVLIGLVLKAAGSTANGDSGIRQTYFALRVGAALFLGLLVFSISHQIAVSDACLQQSVSAYYFTPARAVFVGALCAVGACLVIYRGNNDTENVFLDYTGFMAFVVAFVPTGVDRSCTPSNVPNTTDLAALIDNSASVLFLVAFVAIVMGMAVRWLRPNADGPLSKYAVRALGATMTALIVGLVWFLYWPEAFQRYGHGVAAGALFVGIVAVVGLNAAGFAKREPGTSRMDRNWYLAVLAAMVLSLIAMLVAKGMGYQHWFFTLEAALILEFAAFWLLQTYELRGDVRRQVEASPL